MNESMCLQEEHKRLRGVMEQLDREYEESKDTDVIRRYGMLKGMIKRSVLHIKISQEGALNQNSSAAPWLKEANRKREEHING